MCYFTLLKQKRLHHLNCWEELSCQVWKVDGWYSHLILGRCFTPYSKAVGKKRKSNHRLGKDTRKGFYCFSRDSLLGHFPEALPCPCPKLPGQNRQKLPAGQAELQGSLHADGYHRTESSLRPKNKVAWKSGAGTGQQRARNKALSRTWKGQSSEATNLPGLLTSPEGKV